MGGTEIYSLVSTIITLVLGGGWFIYYRANKKKAYAEAAQAEAEGWKKQQEVYQTTISDLEKYGEFIRNDRNILREENSKLIQENAHLRERINELEKIIFDMRSEQARQGRQIKALSEEIKRK